MNYIKYNMLQFFPFLFDRRALRAMVTWPKFSITAYAMVSSLFKQGICPRTVIDVGANVGQFTVAVVGIFNDIAVHAFEPLPECVDKLRANTSKISNVHIYPVALGARKENAKFYVNSYSLASSLFRVSTKHKIDFLHIGEKEIVNVEVSTLDHFFFNADLSKPVLLKIDVQGAEKLVLEGGKETLKKIDYVLLEASFTPMYESEPLFFELIETMKALNFLFLRPISFLKSPKSGEILQADILFKKVNTIVANL